jgi:hypothetical protein
MSSSVARRGVALVALLVTVAVQGWAQDSAMTQSLERRIPALMEAADR